MLIRNILPVPETTKLTPALGAPEISGRSVALIRTRRIDGAGNRGLGTAGAGAWSLRLGP